MDGSSARPGEASGAPDVAAVDDVRQLSSILHVDMDAFFVSCELVRRPELRGQPVIVGGASRRGVVAAASYEARVYGVHSAMASARAQQLCPHAVFLDGDHSLYGEVSGRVMEIFKSFTPLVEPLSLDEAFLDVQGSWRLHGPPERIARQIRVTVKEQENLTCSVGIAPNKFLAKLATEFAKPKPSRTGPVEGLGVKVVPVGGEQEFLDPLPAKALWGVGPATLAKLERLGVATVAELAALPLDALVASLGKAHGAHLHALSHGRDARRVEPDQKRKSISHEETFPVDLVEVQRVHSEAVRMADAVGNQLRNKGTRGRTISVKVRFGTFETISRSITLPSATDSGAVIGRAARELLAEVPVHDGIRLLGVGVSNLKEGGGEQLSFDALLETDAGSWRDAEDAIDDIRIRFGAGSIGPASSLSRQGIRTKQRGQQQWGPNQDDPEPETP